MPYYEVQDSLLSLEQQQNSSVPDPPPRNIPRNNYNRDSRGYESVSDTDLDPDVLPRKKKGQSRSSKYFCFPICLCILFFFLITISLIVCNHLDLTPAIFQFLQGIKIPLNFPSNGTSLGEPCPTGYILFEETRSCYKAIPIPTLFEDAQSSCEADGAQLTSIHSEIENIFIAGLYHESAITRRLPDLTSISTKWNFWIGMTRTNGSWSWLDGSPVTYKNWRSREETTNEKNHQAVIRATGYKWRGLHGEKRGFVCKNPSRTTSNTKKTSTTRPCPAEYTWLQHTGSCYKVFGNKTSFNNATNVCDDDLAQLTTVHSELEMIFLRGLVMKNREDNNLGSTDMWIGLTHKDHQLHWIDRTEVDYVHWSPGEPNFSNGYNVTKLSYWGRWKSAKPSTEYGFICKKY